jgi:hypothetical protein
MGPELPTPGEEIITAERFAGNAPAVALRKLVKAGVLSKTTMLLSGSLLLLEYVIV